MTHSTPDFNDTLREWYAGELGGEAFFLELARADDTWELPARLERAMGERLLAELCTRGVEAPARPAQAMEKARDSARSMNARSNATIMASLQPRLEAFVRAIRRAAASAPDDATRIASDYVAHEEALLAFARAGSQGGDGADAITQLLDRWHGA